MPRLGPTLLVLFVFPLVASRNAGDDLATRGALAADAPLPVYAPDRADIRNRLFHALFTAPVPATDARHAAAVTRIEGGPLATIAWGASRGAILDDPRFADVLSLLERALEDRSLRAQPPLHRVLLQHDLWTAHDALFARRKALADERSAARCDQLLSLLARLVVRLAPREDEIDALPATPLPAIAARGTPRPDALPAHTAMFGGRIAFTRQDAPAGAAAAVALVGRLVAIDTRGALRTTPLVACVEISTAPGATAASFALDRAALLASPLDAAALVALAPEDPAPASINAPFSALSPGPIAYAPRRERCAACHSAATPPPLDSHSPAQKEFAPEFAPLRAAFEDREGR